MTSQKNVLWMQPKNACCPQLKSKSGSTIYYRSEGTERGAEKAAATRRRRQEQARADKAAAERHT